MGTYLCRTPGARPVDFSNWDLDNDQARAWIYINMEDVQHSHILEKTLAHEAWKTLRMFHGAIGQGRLNSLHQKFYRYKAGSTETVDDIASELTRLRAVIRDIKPEEAPTDLGIALSLLNAVEGEAYMLTRNLLENMDNLTLTLTKERLKTVEQKLRDESTQDGETANKASKSKEDRKCYHCKKPGHIKVNCYRWLATNEGKEYENSHPKDEDAKKADEAEYRDRSTGNEGRRGKKKAKKSTARVAKESDSEDDSDAAWMARDENDQGCTVTNAWIIDSGASRHMTPDESIFTSKRNITQTSVTVANGEKLFAKHTGNVAFSTDGHIVKMTDVLHVPRLDANLLSISALNRKGLNVLFKQHGVEIRRGSTLVATGIMRGKMYFLHASQVALLSKSAGVTDVSSQNEGVTQEKVDTHEKANIDIVARTEAKKAPERSNEEHRRRSLSFTHYGTPVWGTLIPKGLRPYLNTLLESRKSTSLHPMAWTARFVTIPI